MKNHEIVHRKYGLLIFRHFFDLLDQFYSTNLPIFQVFSQRTPRFLKRLEISKSKILRLKHLCQHPKFSGHDEQPL